MTRFTVVSGETVLAFTAKSSLHPVQGKATNLSGYVEADFNPDGTLVLEPAPKMHVEFAVEQLRSGNALQDQQMWKLIDSKRFPTIAADLSSVRNGKGSGLYDADGGITMAGRARRYSGELAAHRDGQNALVEGEIVVDIRDFGLKPPNLLGMLKVDPQVSVKLRLTAAPQE